MALELISHTDGRLDRVQLVRFMTAYQSVAPLTIGELWAWPSMLKLALLENLRRLADETLQSREARLLAERQLASLDGRRSRQRGQPLSLMSSVPPMSCTCCSECGSTVPVHPRSRPR
jgi:Ser/Thr protein kinase RdoA (MazF antagonist)